MTTRADVKVDFSDSPRVALVNAPSQEFVAQDIVDTLRIEEETFRGQTETKLINASGKENLGGGVSVGVTVELQNTEVAFQGRTTPVEIGTITSSTSGAIADRQQLHDTAGSFLTSGVHRGALVINFSDGSIAEVRRIIDDTHLETRELVNGGTNLYTFGDAYQIFKVYQCDITGGNVVAVDENGFSSSPILPTAFTQVIRTASASATTQNLSALEHSSFNNGVVIDTTRGVSGTDFPVGTGLSPSNNLADAYTIAINRGLSVFYVRGVLTLNSGDFSSGFIFKGESPTITQVILVDPSNISSCEFWDVYITGVVDPNTVIRNCIVGPVTSYNGFIWESAIIGPIALGVAGNNETHIIKCWSNVIGAGTPVIDMGGSGTSLAMRDYSGGITLTNKIGPESVSLDIASGQVIIDSTVTNGNIIVRGVGKLQDNSTGTVVVDSDNFLQAGILQDSIQRTTFIGKEGSGVSVNALTGTDSIEWPYGTRNDPCLTETNAHAIVDSRGFRNIYIMTNLTLLEDYNDGHTFYGDSPQNVNINIDVVSDVSNCIFRDSFITGDLTLNNIIRECIVGDISNANGFIYQCAIVGTIQISDNMSMEGCWVGPTANNQTVSVDFNNVAKTVIVSGWSAGKIIVKNMVSGSFFGMTGRSGRVVIDIANAGGTIAYGGGVSLDNTGGGAVDLVRNTTVASQVWNEKTADHIDVGTFGAGANITEVTVGNMALVIDDLIKYQRNKSIIDSTLFTLTIFEDDGLTPLTIFDLKDEAGLASITSIFERIPQ